MILGVFVQWFSMFFVHLRMMFILYLHHQHHRRDHFHQPAQHLLRNHKQLHEPIETHCFFLEFVCLFFEIVWWFYSLEFVCDFMDWGFPLIFVRMFILIRYVGL